MRHRCEHRTHRHRYLRRRRRLQRNYVLDQIADAIVHALYFVFGFIGMILLPVPRIAGVGFIILLILLGVYPESAMYFLMWAFGVGLLISAIGPRLFDYLTRRGRGQLSEIRSASRVRLKEEIPTIQLPDPESIPSGDKLQRR